MKLIYDIETLPLHSKHWRLGEQAIRHGQLIHGHKYVKLICIQYSVDYGPVKVIKRDLGDINSQLSMIEEFDALVKKADVVIGKNSDRFDNKHINTIRLLEGGHPMPDWIRYTDDLEKQVRKYFNLPSYSLDYISDLLGQGGKQRMEWADWDNIDDYFDMLRYEQGISDEVAWTVIKNDMCKIRYGKSYSKVVSEGKKALKKMHDYGKKDVEDTLEIMRYVEKHIEPRYKVPGPKCCKTCGSENIIPDQPKSHGTIMSFYCKDHKGYAGRARILRNGKYGSMLSS